MSDWLFLVYKIPREPTAPRVAVWRKLKQLGALLLHDQVWVLPATPRTHEQLQWLANEISEAGGEASLWVSRAAQERQQRALVEQFSARTEEAYRQILRGLRPKNADLAALARAYQVALAQDFFASALAEKVRSTLLAKGGTAP